ncbi:MAG: ketosteroid isomerase family protein [Cyanobacteria bacterium P01_H01_bin.121]
MALNTAQRDCPQPLASVSLADHVAARIAAANFYSLAVDRYFEAFNRHDFEAVANLFTSEGMLLPPFEDVVQGRAAIAAYLQQEAEGMCAKPRRALIEAESDLETVIRVEGNVQALVFNVNVRWTFILDPHEHIRSVEVELLASLQELLKLRRN